MHIWCYNIKNYYMKHCKNGVSTVFKLMVKLSPHPMLSKFEPPPCVDQLVPCDGIYSGKVIIGRFPPSYCGEGLTLVVTCLATD